MVKNSQKRRLAVGLYDYAPDYVAIDECVAAIKPILAGKGCATQGAVLGELMALHLAGHFADDEEKTKALRREICAAWCTMVEALIPIQEREILRSIEKQ